MEAAWPDRDAQAHDPAQASHGVSAAIGQEGADDAASDPGDCVLRVEHLTMRFGGLIAVDDLSFRPGAADITALIGPNGAGKTTVFNCITGFYKPTEGRIALQLRRRAPLWNELEAVTARALRSRERATARCSCSSACRTISVDQAGARRPHLPEHPPVPGHDGAGESAGGAAQFADARIRLQRARHVRRLPVSAKRRAGGDREGAATGSRASASSTAPTIPPATLPYGAQRRLEIARAMCTDPVLLCLDEPAAGLNPRESAELGRYLQAIRDQHVSVLLIEHDMCVVMEISDHIIVLDYGVKIADGAPAADPHRPEGDRRLSGRRGRGEVEKVEAEVGL